MPNISAPSEIHLYFNLYSIFIDTYLPTKTLDQIYVNLKQGKPSNFI